MTTAAAVASAARAAATEVVLTAVAITETVISAAATFVASATAAVPAPFNTLESPKCLLLERPTSIRKKALIHVDAASLASTYQQCPTSEQRNCKI